MLQTIEAEVDTNGNVHLLEPVKLTAPTRALVTLLDMPVDANRRPDVAVSLREITESMRANSFTGDPPRWTREELHERR